jgi:hypothetical protein
MTDTDKDFHARICVLEEWKAETRELLHQINTKIDGIAAAMGRVSAIQHCPMPGACVELNKEVGEMQKEHKAMMVSIDERLGKLERVQAWATGALAAVSVFWAVIQVLIPFFTKG